MTVADTIHAPQKSALMRRFSGLLDAKTDTQLAELARESAAVTRRNFGKAIRLFAPLYLSN